MAAVSTAMSQGYVRFAGCCYLLIIGLGLYFETMVRGNLIVAGDAIATAAQISAAQTLWRSGIVADLCMQLLDIPIIVLFYLLFKRVNAALNLTATGFNLIQTAMLVANKLTLMLPLLLAGSGVYLAAFSAEQRDALAYLAIQLHGYGFAIGLLFFALACIIRGYLIIKSQLFPKILGLMLGLAGVCYLINTLALLMAPDVAAKLFPWIMLPVLVGELSLSLWMIVKGANLKGLA
ncbi:DUF4386 domain-containing protein [Rheinheimera maricola]|uniref:DUF4386 domain-containing protein n=1 Tax=Rheinheimera maricola TaxID=2793282 RepID=A0ABS7XDF6_9GAMM|nr:DUF4386 domain-containing protein [Rheinheimera maricola]MBZ9612632.1 DUF4386 domain-containing protein [Rheinheimera maricola]